jgi:hypothetical protein
MSEQRQTRPSPNLLASRSTSTPIPPSLQAKMLAYVSKVQPPSIDETTAAFHRASIAPDPPIPPPRIRSRLKPNFTLKDIQGPSAGGVEGAGLGQGRPSFAMDPPRRHQSNNFSSPFSNFSRIVSVSFPLTSPPYLISYPVIPLVLSTLTARPFSMHRASTFPTASPMR